MNAFSNENNPFRFFRNRNYTLKEHIRAIQSEIIEIEEDDENGNSTRESMPYKLNKQQFHTDRVALTEHCNEFNCFYIDLNNQLQRIAIPSNEFTIKNAFEDEQRALEEKKKSLQKREISFQAKEKELSDLITAKDAELAELRQQLEKIQNGQMGAAAPEIQPHE